MHCCLSTFFDTNSTSYDTLSSFIFPALSRLATATATAGPANPAKDS